MSDPNVQSASDRTGSERLRESRSGFFPRPEPASQSTRVARGTRTPTSERAFANRVAAATPIPGNGMWKSTFREKWSRRAITIPGLCLLTLAYAILMPILLLACPIIDLARGRRQLLLRFHVAFFSIFVWHIVALVGLFGVWILNFGESRKQSEAWFAANRRFETFWVNEVIGLADAVYNAEFIVEGMELLDKGPFLILSRHVSVIDAIMPNRVISRVHGTLIRNVIKHELLLDPCVDVMSHRVPRTFVRRGSGNVEKELETMTAVLGGANEDDAILLFPEGTRFTPAKQDRVMKSLRIKHPDVAARYKGLRCVLPPRPAGAFALMDAKPDMDVVFCAHTGLECANRLVNLMNGALLDKKIRVKFWRVSARDIPVELDERSEWLGRWWSVVDEWICEREAS